MSERPDVVVIGAGAAGCSAAYYLAVGGASVLLMDGNSIGSGSTGHSTGTIHALTTLSQLGPLAQLDRATCQMWKGLVATLTEETGIDTLYQEIPHVNLALDDAEEQEIKQLLTLFAPYHKLSWLSGDEIRKMEPRLTPRIRGGMFDADDSAQVDAYRYALALVRAAEKRGAKVLLREAIGLEKQGDKVTAVIHKEGKVECGGVVIAMGWWSHRAMEWLGIDAPMTVERAERCILQFPGDRLPALFVAPNLGHLLTLRDGPLSIGGLITSQEFDSGTVRETEVTQPTEAGKQSILRGATTLMPSIEQAKLVRHVGGAEPLSPDRLPLLGPVPRWEGVYLATGHGHLGIMEAPISGKIVADLVLEGRSDVGFPVEAFSPARFVTGEWARPTRRWLLG